MTEFNTPILKQMLINKMDLCNDISNEIKSYCFYDVKSWQTINFARQSKNKINNLIKYSCISRNNPHGLFENNLADIDEQWIFWIFDNEENVVQFHSINCEKCGNYKFTVNDVFPDSIRCICYDYNLDGDFWNFE
jgi:hypothetical protein